jgi:dethiobiotin synthetase
VGKTYVTARLAKMFAESGETVCVLKLVQTGCEHDDDAAVCGAFAGVDVRTVYALPFSASPHLSAQKAGVRIDVKKIIRAVREAASMYDAVLIEGSGGLLVPVDAKRTLLDIAESMGLAVLLVAANRLGVINHTLLSLNELKHRGMRCIGVVFNAIDTALHKEIAADNLRIVKTLGATDVFGPLPFSKSNAMTDAQRRVFSGIVKKVRGYGLADA